MKGEIDGFIRQENIAQPAVTLTPTGITFFLYVQSQKIVKPNKLTFFRNKKHKGPKQDFQNPKKIIFFLVMCNN